MYEPFWRVRHFIFFAQLNAGQGLLILKYPTLSTFFLGLFGASFFLLRCVYLPELVLSVWLDYPANLFKRFGAEHTVFACCLTLLQFLQFIWFGLILKSAHRSFQRGLPVGI